MDITIKSHESEPCEPCEPSLVESTFLQVDNQATCVQLSAAMFLIKTKEECKLTQVSIDKLVTSVRGLWDQAMQDLRQRLASSLPDEIDESIFDTPLFDGIETHYLQQKYYREHFRYVVC